MARRPRAAAAKGSVYVTSNHGILKSTSASADFTQAGIPRCLDLILSLTNSSPTLLASNAGRAYRGVWCNRDANNLLVSGAPSSRAVLYNTAGATRDAQAVVQCPPEITTAHFFQLHATSLVTATTTDPGDEMRLVQEYFPTTADITAGSITLADATPDALRGYDLETNETQDGQASQNDRPPLGRDLCWYNNKLLVANYTDPHRLTLQMVGTSGMTTQTITLAGVVYTAGTAESTATGTFQVFKSGGGGYTDKGTQALNVEYTAKSFCYIVNKYAATTGVWAYYQSGTDDAPGSILIEERGVGGSAFVVTCSATAMGASFSPIIPTTGSAYISIADRRVNQIRVSEDGQPEHMPRARNIIVGGEDEEIQRIIALKSTLFVIKDRSIWSLTDGDPGEAPSFVDNTAAVMGRDSVAVLNNVVYMLSDQGFVSITQNGIQIVGRPIEDKVLAGLEKVNAPDHDKFVGVGYERQRYYMCSAYDAAASELTCYRFSPISASGNGAWTRRRLNAHAFAVNGSRLYYALNNAFGHVLRENKSRRDGNSWYYDYAEEAATFTISTTTSTTATGVLSSQVNYNSYLATDPGYGWKLYDGANQYLVLSSTGTSPNYVLTLNTTTSLSNGAKTLYRPVTWKVEYAPIAGNPLELKQFGPDVVVKAETSNAYAIDIGFANQQDTKTDPTQDSWDAAPAAQRVYVGLASGVEPSSTSNDFSATPSTFNQFNEVRTGVDSTRAVGQQLSVRISGAVAHGFVAIKALLVQVLGTESVKVRQ